MAGDPVAWRVIERGWRVLDAAGNEVGSVDRIVGDVDADIFNGIAFGDGGTVLTRSRYVPAEHVAEIWEGEIVLDLPPEEVAKLEPYQEPISEPLADLAAEDEPEAPRKSGLQEFLDRLFGRRPS